MSLSLRHDGEGQWFVLAGKYAGGFEGDNLRAEEDGSLGVMPGHCLMLAVGIPKEVRRLRPQMWTIGARYLR